MTDLTVKVPRLPTRIDRELSTIIESCGGMFILKDDHSSNTIGLFRTLQTRFDMHVKYANQVFYRDKPRDIEYGFLSKTVINAFAYSSPLQEKDPFDFIGINVGVIYTLLGIFNKMLSHSSILPDIGNPNIEKVEQSHLSDLVTDVIGKNIHIEQPLCPVRAGYASLLQQTALDFLFFHELTHLLNGHVDYRRSKMQFDTILEMMKTDKFIDDMMVNQTLEIDADCGSIHSTIAHAFRLKDMFSSKNNFNDNAQYESMKKAYGCGYSSIRLVSIAVYILFRICGPSRWYSTMQATKSHPFAPIRSWFSSCTLYEVFKTVPAYRYNELNFSREHILHVNDAENAVSMILNKQNADNIFLEIINNPDSLQYLKSFKTTWKTIRPKLEKFKRGGILAQ
jgi:hypothetical protein